MTDTNAVLRALVCEMYQHTAKGAATRRHAQLTVSAEVVRRAPTSKRASAEMMARLREVERSIQDDYLNGVATPLDTEKLRRWARRSLR